MDRWQRAQEGELKYWVSAIKAKVPDLDREKVKSWLVEFGLLRTAQFGAVKIIGTVFDLGCGPISIFEGMPDATVVAVDPLLGPLSDSLPGVVLLGHVNNVEYVADIIDDAIGYFDVIWCVNVLDHTANWQHIVEKFGELTRPEALLLLGVDVRHSSKTLNQQHISQITEEELLAELTSNFIIDWHTPVCNEDTYYFVVRAYRR